MYLPRHYQVTDQAVLYDLMRRFSFATLVSVHQGVPFATHLPFFYQEGVISSHLARANPQWTDFDPNQELLVIFQGDHSFISPTWYEKHPSVPTWNYMTVHAYGKPRIVEEPQAVKQLLHELVVQHEQEWDMMQLPPDYLPGMMQGIVAFEIAITRLEGKFKLSQNRSLADQKRVIQALSVSENPSDRAVAAQMRKNLGED